MRVATYITSFLLIFTRVQCVIPGYELVNQGLTNLYATYYPSMDARIQRFLLFPLYASFIVTTGQAFSRVSNTCDACQLDSIGDFFQWDHVVKKNAESDSYTINYDCLRSYNNLAFSMIINMMTAYIFIRFRNSLRNDIVEEEEDEEQKGEIEKESSLIVRRVTTRRRRLRNKVVRVALCIMVICAGLSLMLEPNFG